MLASVALLAGCGRGLPRYAPFAASVPIPTFAGPCPAGGPSSGRVKVRVLDQSRLTSEIFAPVCIAGRGPFPFLVDTGSSLTVVDVSLAARLGLELPAGKVVAPCSSIRYFVSEPSMSIGKVAVGPTQIEIGGLASKTFPLVGIIGANALSRFAAVRFDYRSSALTFAAPGGPVPPKLISGTRSTVPLLSFPSGRPVSGQGGPVEVAATVGTVETSLLLDTGAQGTLLLPTVISRAGLVRLPLNGDAYAGVGCVRRLSYFSLGRWRIGGITMPAQPVASLSNFLVAGGSLGSGTLEAHSPVVIDYLDGKLFLGR